MERKSNINYIIGLIFIVPGAFLLMDKLNIFHIRDLLNFSLILKSFWATIFLIIPGLFLHIIFFSGGKTTPSYIIMGGVLTFMGFVARFHTCMGYGEKCGQDLSLRLHLDYLNTTYLEKENAELLSQ